MVTSINYYFYAKWHVKLISDELFWWIYAKPQIVLGRSSMALNIQHAVGCSGYTGQSLISFDPQKVIFVALSCNWLRPAFLFRLLMYFSPVASLWLKLFVVTHFITQHRTIAFLGIYTNSHLILHVNMICIYSVILKEMLEVLQQQIFETIDGNQGKSQMCKIFIFICNN